MSPTLDAHVDAAIGPIDLTGLINDEARRRAETVARLIPAAASDFFGFECRLDDPSGSADFLACIAVDGREAWRDALPPSDLPPDAPSRPAWERLAGIVRRWSDPADPLHETIHNMWVEFDLDNPALAPTPSVFMGSDTLTAAADPAWLIDASAELTGAPLSPMRRTTIVRCLAALPTGADLFQTGMMLSRPAAPVRLCLRGLANDDIPRYLTDVGRAGDAEAVRVLLEETARLSERIILDLDADEGVGDRIGVEIRVAGGPGEAERLVELLRLPTARGSVLPVKAAAAPLWYGLTHERLRPDRWPADLTARADRPGPGCSGVFQRGVNHVKVTLEAGRPIGAKIYLYCAFGWVDDAELRGLIHADPLERAIAGRSW